MSSVCTYFWDRLSWHVIAIDLVDLGKGIPHLPPSQFLLPKVELSGFSATAILTSSSEGLEVLNSGVMGDFCQTIYTLCQVCRLMSGSLQWQNWHRRGLEEKLQNNCNLHLRCSLSPVLPHTLLPSGPLQLYCCIRFKKIKVIIKTPVRILTSTLNGHSGSVGQWCNKDRKLHTRNNLQLAREQLQKSVICLSLWLVLPFPS